MPLPMSALTVTMERSLGERPSRFQTSPKRTSSLRWANSGANSPRTSWPAVCLMVMLLPFLMVCPRREERASRLGCRGRLLWACGPRLVVEKTLGLGVCSSARGITEPSQNGADAKWGRHKNRAGCPKADTQVGICGAAGRCRPSFSPEKTRANVRPMC